MYHISPREDVKDLSTTWRSQQGESQAQKGDELQAETVPPPQEDDDDTAPPQQLPAQQSIKTSTVDKDNEERELDPPCVLKTNFVLSALCVWNRPAISRVIFVGGLFVV